MKIGEQFGLSKQDSPGDTIYCDMDVQFSVKRDVQLIAIWMSN